ncbi:hypothetical protein [Microbacterium jejuense]|uniref:hypothetical protein n=1 Tax=Microbacterium jejuense TaxID=1263637 RepID=UPI0031EAC7DB
MDFDAALDEAEQIPDDSMSLKVCINRAIARKRAELLDALDAARKAEAKQAAEDPRLGATGPVDTTASEAALAAFEAHEPEVQNALIELKFTRLDPNEWTLLTQLYPMRPEVQLDRHYGYNFDEVSKQAARRSGVRLDGDSEVSLTEAQWTRMFGKKVLSAPDLARVVDVIWTLNEYKPAQDIAALVKGSGVA